MINRTTENILLYYCVILRNKTRFYTPFPRAGGFFRPENIIAFLPFFSIATVVYPVHPKHANAALLAAIAIIPTRHPMAQIASKYIYTPCLNYPIFRLSARPHVKTCFPRRILYFFFCSVSYWIVLI